MATMSVSPCLLANGTKLMRLPSQVVQYILDLNDNRFSDAVIRQFLGNVCALSVQKFSSNVIEKVRFSFGGLTVLERSSLTGAFAVHPGCRASHAQAAGRRVPQSQ